MIIEKLDIHTYILKCIDQVYGWDKKPMRQPTKKELDDFCVEYKEYLRG